MSKIKIGILKEGKVPVDHRVAITPAQARHIKNSHKDVELICQHSDVRCFKDEDYHSNDIELSHDISSCDLLFAYYQEARI